MMRNDDYSCCQPSSSSCRPLCKPDRLTQPHHQASVLPARERHLLVLDHISMIYRGNKYTK